MACCGPQSHEFQPALFCAHTQHRLGIDTKEHQAIRDEGTDKYINQICHKYKAKPNPGVLVMLRFGTTTFKASQDFEDIDMLCLADLMLTCPLSVEHVTSIDLSYSKVGVHGIIALAEVLKVNTNVSSLFLHGIRISSMGAEALSLALGNHNRSVRYVDMRACRIGQAGGEHIAKNIVANDNATIQEMDLTVNNIGNDGLICLRQALQERQKRHKLHYDSDSGTQARNLVVSSMVLDLEGNLVLEEIMNSLTHGLGIVMCAIGTSFLLNRASEYGISEQLAAVMYSCSLLLLYTSSTLYHAFFCCKATNKIFQTLDRSAIYLLIAGTYTPVLMLALPHNFWTPYLLWFQWICCFVGMMVEFADDFVGKVTLELIMYMLMGWSVLICFEDLKNNMTEGGLFWLTVGGLFYTGGVPFFLSNFHMSHVIWHMFVLGGSITQWWAVYQHVLPLDPHNSKGQGVALAREMTEEIGDVIGRTINTCADMVSR
eukprot:CAMPEP_0197523456 /NCGR_PEP_ID=MMETSP1318-20131121/8377_1 /TAXON_ID=552666 /ORGANISM="Partenskyella glossopodia, Strain RCC365" /LENGTH=485 /DNA_ID=CAMNT_0043076153 /DNA_START=126 /DNA_END=1583 /DNA_ORIENTATION=-